MNNRENISTPVLEGQYSTDTIGELLVSFLQSDEPLAVAIRQHAALGSMSSDRWIDNQDVIERYHISKRTLQNLRNTGALPFALFAGRCFYKPADVEALINKNYHKTKEGGCHE